MLTIDRREKRLLEVYDAPHAVETLDVGDFICRYEDKTWIGERKTVQDLAASLKDGRWHEQTARLLASGCKVVFIVEGDLKSVQFSYESLIGAAVNTELRRNCHMFRTWDIWETALLLKHLVSKMQCCSTSAPNGLRLVSKRKRDADTETCYMRMLMCVPSVSENVAKALLKRFGTLPNLQRALVDLSTFPRIRLNDRTCIGAKRLKTLRAYLVSA